MVPKPLTVALIASLLLFALLINLYLVPVGAAIGLLYAVSVVYAAYRSTPLAAGLTDALAVTLYLITANLKGRPIQAQLAAALGLLIVGYLAARMSRQRQEAARHSREADAERQRLEAERRRLEESIVRTRHDLAQPVTIIEGYAKLLAKRLGGDEDSPELRAVGSIQRSAHRIEAMIEEMRAVTQTSSGASGGA